MDLDQAHEASIELVERDAFLDLYAAAPEATRKALKIAHGRIGSMGLIAGAAVPATELNRAMMVGGASPASPAELAEAADWLRKNAEGWAFQVSPSGQTRENLDWFEAQGLKPTGNGWAKFFRTLSPSDGPDTIASDVEVRLVGAADAEAFGRVVQSGFRFSEPFIEWFAALVSRPGWSAYLAYDGDTPIASGTMFAKDGKAWVGISTTLADHRRRGAHVSLIARRVADARAAGVTFLSCDTGYPSPGDTTAFPSYRNMQRAGFTLAYVRPNYKPA